MCIRPPLFLGLLLGRLHLLGNRERALPPFPAQFVDIEGGPQLIVGHLLVRQWLGIGQVAPGQKRAALHRGALIVIDNFIRGVVGRFREGSDVHRALGGVILVKAGGLDLHHADLVNALILYQPIGEVLLRCGEVTPVMSPLILPLARFIIVTGPGHIGGWGCGVFSQGKTSAVFQHNSPQNGVALIFVHKTSFSSL